MSLQPRLTVNMIKFSIIAPPISRTNIEQRDIKEIKHLSASYVEI